MGAWDSGPFDNDDAADFAYSLDSVPEHERVGVIRAALLAAVENDGAYLGLDVGAPAAAAAALIASRMPGGGEFVPSHYGPQALLPDIPPDLAQLAIRAVDRVLADESELQALWAEDMRAARPWHSSMNRLRSVLAGPDIRTPLFEAVP
jgi:hypothetical protein